MGGSKFKEVLKMASDFEAKTIMDSALFDEQYYQEQLLAQSMQPASSPVQHYLSIGSFHGLKPHPLFDPNFYLAQYPDVAAADVNPLVHYILHGASEGRNPNPFFDTRFYLQSMPELDRHHNPLKHYSLTPIWKKSSTHKCFDPLHYITCYPEVLIAGQEPLDHYLAIGAKQNRQAFIDFDPSFYLASYPDVAGAEIDPWIHFSRFGRDEGRLPRRPGQTVVNETLIVNSLRPGKTTARSSGSNIAVYWGSVVSTSAQLNLLKSVVSSLPQVQFHLHQALIPNASWHADNLKISAPLLGDDEFFGGCGMFVNGCIDAPISELMLAAIEEGLLMISPEASEVSKLLPPDEASLIPCEALLSSMIVHAIVYALANGDDMQERTIRAAQRLTRPAGVTGTSR